MTTLLDVKNTIELNVKISFQQLAKRLTISEPLLASMLYHLQQIGVIEECPMITQPCHTTGRTSCRDCSQHKGECYSQKKYYCIKTK